MTGVPVATTFVWSHKKIDKIPSTYQYLVSSTRQSILFNR